VQKGADRVEAEKKPRILVVDDDPGLQTLVKALLVRADMEPIAALNAEEAVQALRHRPLPDVLILDLMLPDISGITLLRQLRSKEVFNGLPVIILSAMADPDTIREGLSSGADRYLTKPYLANNLIKTLHEIMHVERKAAPPEE